MKKKNILINFRGGIGDFILLTPVIRNIYAEGNYNMYLLCDSKLKELVVEYKYFVNHFFVDYKKNIFYKFIYLVKIFFRFHKTKIDISVTPVCTLSRYNILITKVVNSKISIGFSSSINKKTYLYQIEIKKNMHDIEQNLEVLKYLDVECVTKKTEVIISERSIKTVNDYLTSKNIVSNILTVAVAPLVEGMRGYSSRAWPLGSYVNLVNLLTQNHNITIILFGSPKEIGKLRSIRSRFYSDRIFFPSQSFSLSDSIVLLSRCGLLVCNDGGVMHIAAALNIPIVSMWGPTNPAHRGYLDRNNFIAIRNDSCEPCRDYNNPIFNCKSLGCLTKISVMQVYSECKKFIKIT